MKLPPGQLINPETLAVFHGDTACTEQLGIQPVDGELVPVMYMTTKQGASPDLAAHREEVISIVESVQPGVRSAIRHSDSIVCHDDDEPVSQAFVTQ